MTTQYLYTSAKYKKQPIKVLRVWIRKQLERKAFSVGQVDQYWGKQTLQKTQQLLVQVHTGWVRAKQEYAISRKRSECMPAAPCPSIHPSMLHSQPRTEPASCVRAHLGTVHVCSRRREIARNHSWTSWAFANRLAGIWEQEWRKTKKKKALKRNVEREKRRLAMESNLRGGEGGSLRRREEMWD